jgi:hypothetical protein
MTKFFFDGLSKLGKRSVNKQIELMFGNDKELIRHGDYSLWAGNDGVFVVRYSKGKILKVFSFDSIQRNAHCIYMLIYGC